MTQNSPSDEELQEFFKQLDEADKDDLLRLSRSEQSRRLKFLYYRHQGTRSKFHDEYLEFRELFGRYHRFGLRGGRSRGGRSRGNLERGRNRGGPKGGFGSEKRPPFDPGNKEFRKGPPRG